MQKKLLSRLCLVITAAILTTMTTDCCGIRTTASVKPALTMYKKTAIIWGGSKDAFLETLFLSYWMDNFPDQTIVERKELSKIIREQDLLKGRLNEVTRARLHEILGVDAIVIANFISKKRNQFFEEENSDLSIKIIDTETGEISVSAISKGSSNCNDSIIIETVRKIRDQLDKNVYITAPHKGHGRK